MSERKKRGLFVVLFSVILAGIQVVARSFSVQNSWNSVFSEEGIKTEAVVQWMVVSMVFLLITGVIFRFLDSHEATNEIEQQVRWRQVAKLATLFFVCWLPYLILMYPASGNADVMDQLGQFFHIDALNWTQRFVVLKDPAQSYMNNHHPVTHTLILGCFVRLGQFLGSANLGLFFLVFIQSCGMAFVFAYGVCYMKRKGVHKVFLAIAIVFYCGWMMNGLTVTSVCKDTLFTIFILAGTLYSLEMADAPGEFLHSKKRIIAGIIIFSGIILMRNNGCYILLVMTLVTLISMKENRKKLLLIMGLPVLLFGIMMPKILFPMLNIASGHEREMFSVPLQQLARTLCEHKDEMNQEDVIYIGNIMDSKHHRAKEIVRRYHKAGGRSADLIKNFYGIHTKKDQRNHLFQIWFRYLKQYPTTYVQATLNNTYQYFYYEKSSYDIYYNGLFADRGWDVYRKNMKQYLKIENTKTFHWQRIALLEAVRKIRLNPATRWIVNVGFFTCVFFLGLWYCIYKKRWTLLRAYGFLIINLCISFLGPLVYLRYSYGYIVSIPLLFGLSTVKK